MEASSNRQHARKSSPPIEDLELKIFSVRIHGDATKAGLGYGHDPGILSAALRASVTVAAREGPDFSAWAEVIARG
jgi:hypothetical protein